MGQNRVAKPCRRNGLQDGVRSTCAIAMLAVGLLFGPAAVAAETVHFTYDALGRVIAVEYVGGVNDGLVIEYAYDAAGNRIQIAVED